MMAIIPRYILLTTVVFSALAEFFHPCHCYTSKDVERFLENKVSKYDKRIRPIFNQSSPVFVDVTFYLIAVQEFDEVLEKISFSGYFTAVWNDEIMTWNPEDYGGMELISLDGGTFWKPNIILGNSAEKIIRLYEDWMPILYTYDGSAFFYFGDDLTVWCKMDTTYYPWDKQLCYLYVITMPNISSQIILTSSAKNVLRDKFFENGAWTFEYSTVVSDLNNTALQFNISLHRKSTFFIVNIILPIIFMSFLNSIVFIIPAESGERISYGITVFLSLAVFLTLVSDNLPKTSNPMSLFSYYILSVLIISIGIILATTLSLRLFYMDETLKKPRCLVQLVKFVLRKDGKHSNHKCYDQEEKIDHESTRNQRSKRTYENYLTDYDPNGHFQEMTYRQRQMQHMQSGNRAKLKSEDKKNKKSNQEINDEREYKNLSWKEVSLVVDKILFLFFVIAAALVTAIFLIMIRSG